MWALCKWSCSHKPISQYQRYLWTRHLLQADIDNRKKGGNGRPAKSGIKRWRSSSETSSSCRKTGCWVNQKKKRETPSFGCVPKCNEGFPGTRSVESHQTVSALTEAQHRWMCCWFHLQAGTSGRRAAKPCKRPTPWDCDVFANIILWWRLISLKGVKKKKKERETALNFQPPKT